MARPIGSKNIKWDNPEAKKLWLKEYGTQRYRKNPQAQLEQARAYYHAHKDNRDWVARQKVYYARYSQRLRLRALKSYSKDETICCVLCGIKDIDVLQIDHINGGGNKQRKELGSKGRGSAFYIWLRDNEYPDGYQVLCANCNVKKSIKERELNRR